jgi:hypothetical protein
MSEIPRYSELMVRSGVEKKARLAGHNVTSLLHRIIIMSCACSKFQLTIDMCWAKLLEYIIMNSRNNQVNVLDFQGDLLVEKGATKGVLLIAAMYDSSTRR